MAKILISPVKTLAVALMLLAACAASCKRDGSKSASLNPAAATEVKAQLNILQDSVNAKWRDMTENDDQKIGVTRLLLRELKAQPGANADQLQALEEANNKLKDSRYTQQTMASSDLINQYDNAQESLLNTLYPVAAPNGAAPTENARNFVEGIQQLDAKVVGLRVQYDQAVHQYNDYLKLHQAELQSLGGKYADLKPLSFFTIGAQ